MTNRETPELFYFKIFIKPLKLVRQIHQPKHWPRLSLLSELYPKSFSSYYLFVSCLLLVKKSDTAQSILKRTFSIFNHVISDSQSSAGHFIKLPDLLLLRYRLPTVLLPKCHFSINRHAETVLLASKPLSCQWQPGVYIRE